jgi:Predicted permeases
MCPLARTPFDGVSFLRTFAMPDLSLMMILLLLGAAFLAGFIDAIAGGGGLITIPALLLAGYPPVAALGTNKVQGLFGSGSATIAYARGGHVNVRKQIGAAVLAGGGSALGALLATVLPGQVFAAVLPPLLIAIALYFALKPNMTDVDKVERLSPFIFTLTFVPLIGAYDGLFGPGAGSFYMLAFVAVAGYGLLKATAHTKLLNFSSNVGAFLVFAVVGVIDWKIGLSMGVAQFLGAQVGSRLAMRNGARVIKPLLVVTCVALATKLLSDPANPVRVWLGV